MKIGGQKMFAELSLEYKAQKMLLQKNCGVDKIKLLVTLKS